MPPTSQYTARDVLNELSPEARKLAQKVIQIENKHLDVQNPTQVVPGIVDAVKGLTK